MPKRAETGTGRGESGPGKGKSRLSPLFTGYVQDRIESISRRKNPLERETTAHRFVADMTEERYDVFSMVELAHAGVSALLSADHKETGHIILTQLETYLSSHDILLKYLLPPKRSADEDGRPIEIPDKESYQRYIGLYKDLDRLMGIVGYRTAKSMTGRSTSLPELNRWVHELEQTANSSADDAQRITVIHSSSRVRSHGVTVSVNGFDKNAPFIHKDDRLLAQTRAAKEQRQGMVQESFDLLRKDEREFILCPERLIDKMMQKSHMAGDFDCLNARYGNTSLHEIIHETDQRTRSLKTAQFVAALPKGDLFWRQVVKQILFMPQTVPDAKIIFAHPDWSEGIYQTQFDLASRVLVPTFIKGAGIPFEEGDTEMTNAISHMMGEMNEELFRSFVLSTYNAAKLTSSVRQIIHPDEDMSVYVPQQALYAVAIESYMREKLHVTAPTTVALMIDEVVHWCFEHYHHTLVADWKRNFALPMNKADELRQDIGELTEKTFETIHTEHILSALTKRLGADFFEGLKQQDLTELDAVGSDMIRLFSEEGMMEYWPSTGTPHKLSFSERSHAAMLGFESVTFLTPMAGEEQKIQFMLHLRDPKTAIKGSFPVDFLGDNGLTLSINIDGNEGFRSILRVLVVSAFHDVVLANKLESEQSDKKTGPKSPAASVGITEDGSENKKKRHKNSARYAPRAHLRVLDQPLIEENQDELEHAIDTLISAKDREYKPRRVDSHPMTLRGAVAFQTAVRALQERQKQFGETPNLEQQAELEILEAEVARTRGEMFHMSEAKQSVLDSLPPTFRTSMRTLQDPTTGEEVHLDTWVVQYDAPKPTEEEKASYQLMYERRYKKGPKMRFLDAVMARVFKEERGMVEDPS